MNMVLRELKASSRALIIWSVSMFLCVLTGTIKFTAYTTATSTGPSINELLKTMPTSIKALFGFASFDMATMAGYLALLFIYVELVAAIHAALLGAGIIAKEESDKTTEYLMTKPVSRAAIVTSKLVAALLNVVVINVVTLVSFLVVIPLYSKGNDISGEVLMLTLSMFVVQLIFLSLGAVLAAWMRHPRTSGSVATGVLFTAYFVARITDMSDKLRFLNVISPFKYFDLGRMVAGNGLNTGIVLLSLALVAAFTALTYVFYQKRDLNI
ncbi:ABC transporter permease subunit [Candidatus Cryosericum terrychapinii]|jgi:ABC-2 type transport system permease protein|uniref:ABC transporter n=1 Tax=Candidatus Cryosericum terrychapinii TaxID=2290919 RepID=A0A398CXT4_9BACT|nr:ABC transporter permease subunit [Candidatus Cryosericum terrychapinii]RIE06049.1 ABC transporter [Candidatus Cryosericum terrychapinii]